MVCKGYSGYRWLAVPSFLFGGLKMKVTKAQNGFKVVDFNSLAEFSKYINETPENPTFENAFLSSHTDNYQFTQTESYEEAMKLFNEGWSAKAQDLVINLAKAEKKAQSQSVNRRAYDVAGGFVSVPRYIQGKPNCMIRMKKQQIKQRVITIYKSIDYSGNTSADTIVEQSVKAMQLIKRIESLGYRVNLFLTLGIKTSGDTYRTIVNIKLKDASEKLNVSKLAFPLAHPSMLRRLMFRFIEVSKFTNSRKFIWSYGKVVPSYEMKETLLTEDGTYFIPSFIYRDCSQITSIEDIAKYGGNFAE